MATARIITYECEQCGSEIIVTSTGETRLSPIFCCGIEVGEISSGVKKSAAPKKKAKKSVKKTVVAKKKTVVKKKTSKK